MYFKESKLLKEIDFVFKFGKSINYIIYYIMGFWYEYSLFMRAKPVKREYLILFLNQVFNLLYKHKKARRVRSYPLATLSMCTDYVNLLLSRDRNIFLYIFHVWERNLIFIHKLVPRYSDSK